MTAEGRDFWDGAVSMSQAAQSLHSIPSITSPYSANPLEITLLVYCHNAADTIIQTLETLVEAMDVVEKSFEILVMDDGSTDHSAELVRGFITDHPQLNIVMRVNKQPKGLAQNYFDGAFMGRGTYYRLVLGDEPVETMVDILKSIGDADIIVPYYITRLKQGAFQSFMARLFTMFINLISGNRIYCYTSPHVHLRYNVMRWHSDILGAAFQMDLLCQLLALDFTSKQVPCRAVSAVPGHGGGVKNTLSFLHAILNIVLRRFARLMH